MRAFCLARQTVGVLTAALGRLVVAALFVVFGMVVVNGIGLRVLTRVAWTVLLDGVEAGRVSLLRAFR